MYLGIGIRSNKLFALILTLFFAPFSFASGVSNYVLGPGDAINIQVYGEDDLSIEFMLDSSGSFDYPYLGQLTASGLSVNQLKDLIRQGLEGDYLINPKVRVNVTTFRHIYVNGEVKKQGDTTTNQGLLSKKPLLWPEVLPTAQRKEKFKSPLVSQTGKPLKQPH